MGNVALTGVALGLGPWKARKYSKNANEARDLYLRAVKPDDVVRYREEYEEQYDLYQQEKDSRGRYMAITIPAMAAMYGVSAFLIHKLANISDKPVFDDKNPFAHIQMGIIPDVQDMKRSQIGLVWKF